MSHKKAESDRREFLKQLMVGTGVASSGLLNVFITNMMANMFQSATAYAAGEEAAFQDFKLISLILSGGAPRHYWDLPINPNGSSDQMVSNPMIINSFSRSSGGIITPYYATTQIGNYHMPHIWSGNIPTSSGVAPMRNLAQNMLTMRGIDLQADSHTLNMIKQMAPIAGVPSLTGLLADQAVTPVPAIGRNGGGDYFKSEKGIGYVEFGGPYPLSNGLSPFQPTGSMKSIHNGDVEKAIDDVLKRMSVEAADKGRYLPNTFVARFNAKKIMMRQFDSLNNSYEALKAKYQNLISRAFAADENELRLTGIDSFAIPGGFSNSFNTDIGQYVSSPDMRTLTHSETNITDLAESMAIAEYMIMEGLSSSINVAVGNFTDLFFQQTSNSNGNVLRTNMEVFTYTMDVHETGAQVSAVLFSRYYRAISACLYELISRLKSKNLGGHTLFDKTVLAVNSEFNRLPRINGSGADHGWRGSNYTLFSGMIPQLMVSGNIHVNGDNRGTWGHAAPLSELGGREAIIGNAASTVAALLEIKTPTPNDQSFIYKEGGKAKLSIKSLKNIA